MFIDGLSTNLVLYITLYDNIMIFLNEPHNSLLPNIHQLFDHVARINSNVTHSRLLNHDTRLHQAASQPAIASSPVITTTLTATDSATGTTRKCNNHSQMGQYTNETCFQTGGKMEGRREEYLANQPMRA
jgi:hypothetical protein